MRRGLRHWARFGRPASPELGTAVPLWGAGARKLAVPSVALIQRFHSSRRAFFVRLCCPLIRSPPISPNAYPTRCCSLNITRYHRSRSFSLVGIFSVCTAPKTRNGVKPAVFVNGRGNQSSTTLTLIIPRRHELTTACCRPTTSLKSLPHLLGRVRHISSGLLSTKLQLQPGRLFHARSMRRCLNLTLHHVSSCQIINKIL